MERIGLNVVQGFVSQLDPSGKAWVPLLNELCFIEVKKWKISLFHHNQVLLFEIVLQPNFEFALAQENGITLWPTSTVKNQVYSFSFSDPMATSIFRQSLEQLKLRSSPQFNYPSNSRNNANFRVTNPNHHGLSRPNYHQMNQFQSAPVQRNQNTQAALRNPFRTVAPKQVPVRTPFQNVMPQSYLVYEEAKLDKPFKNNNDRPLPQPPLRQNFIDESYEILDEKIQNIPPDRRPPPIPPRKFSNRDDDYYQVPEGNLPPPIIDNNPPKDFPILENLHLSEKDELCQLLTDAIAEGNSELAQEFVTKLAQSMLKIDFSIKPKRTNFNLLIQIVDKDTDIDERITVTECVDPKTTTIQYLKAIMYRKHHLNVDKQVWIIGKNICSDNQTLSECGIKTTGSTVYLYMKAAEQPDITRYSRENFMCDQSVETDEDITHFYQDLQQEAIQDDLANRLGFVRVGDAHQVGRDANLMAAPPVPEFKGWNCPDCTYENPPTFEGCKICSASRPDDYIVPENYVMTQEEVERVQNAKENEELALRMEQQRLEDEKTLALLNYQRHLLAMDEKLCPNEEPFECLICFLEVEAGEGVVLRECLHSFCRECLSGTINNSEEAEVQCPYNEGFACPAIITQPEIQELLTPDDYEKYLTRCVNAAERGAVDSFHCKTANCQGWCFYEDEVNEFVCPICGEYNCLTCKAIHKNQTCKEYQDDLKVRAENDEAAKKTQQMLQDMIAKGEAMNCPQCQIILQKKSGCDWMKCSMCRTEICWATKGPRWGPNGVGDTSGGCRCGLNGPCTPNCGNCH